MMRLQRFLIILLLVLTTVIYLPPAITNDFVSLDDTLLITRNPTAQGLSMQNIAAAFTTYDPELYIPLTLLTYQIEWSFFGPNPAVFHVTNLLLHLGSTLLVFGIMRRLASRTQNIETARWIALGAAAIFALHPLNAQAVLWAAARKDALSTVFFLLSVLFYLRYRSGEPGRPYAGSVAAFGLGLLAKVNIVVLPVLLAAIDWHEGRKPGRAMIRDKFPYALLALVFGCIALFGKRAQIVSLTTLEKILLALKETGFYLGTFFTPTGLSIFYPQETPIVPHAPEFLGAIAAGAVLIGLLVFGVRRHRTLALGIAWYVLLLLPSFLNFWKNGFVYFADDRYSTLPLLGISFALLSLAVPPMLRGAAARRTSAAVAILVLAAFAGLSVRQARTWRDSIALYERVLALHPRSAHALNNLGSSLYEEERFDEAEAAYLRGIEDEPKIPQIYVNLGKLAYRRGDRIGAEAWFKKSIAAKPMDRELLEEDIVGHLFLATLLEERNDIDGAIEQFALAAAYGSRIPKMYLNQGIFLQKHRRFTDAREAFLAYLAREPRDREALYRAAAVEAELGLLREAADHLERLVEIDPDYEKAAEHLRNLRRMVPRNNE